MESKTTESMSVVHTIQRKSQIEPVRAASDHLDPQFANQLLAVVADNLNESDVTDAIVAKARKTLGIETISYFQRQPDGRLLPQEHAALAHSLPFDAMDTLGSWAADTADQGVVKLNTLAGAFDWTVVCVPIPTGHRQPDVLCAAFRVGSRSEALMTSALQLCGTHVTLWHHQQAERRAITDANNSSAMLELIGKLDACDDVTRAGYCFVNEVRQYLDCQRVVLGLTSKDRAACRVVAISGLSGFDQRNELTRMIEAALNETALRKRLTVLTDTQTIATEGTLALNGLRLAVNAITLIGTPLLNQQGEIIGAWLLIDVADNDLSKTQDFVRCSQSTIGSKFDAIQAANAGRLTQGYQAISRLLRARKWMTFLATFAVLIAAMFIPMNYRVACDCLIEPVSRRFVAAPYDGTLLEALVEAGDVVKTGQVLAKMDARELRWELAELEADYKSQQKERDAASARDEVAAAQQSDLQMQRLDIKMQLINHRLKNLEVKSPIDGVVIAGDLKASEGAPLTIGQTVFEIGPLDEMVVEVAVPERDVLHVKPGMKVRLRLDAAMQTTELGTIARVFPRAEIRDAESVYIAEVLLSNRDGRLRPGMKGAAKIVAQRHSLGWILFHKSWESLAMKCGW